MRQTPVLVSLSLSTLLLVSCRSSENKPAAATADMPPPGTVQIADSRTGEPAAGAPDSARKIVERPHLRINNKDTEEEFLHVVKNKNTTLSDIATIDRLVEEKKAEITEFENELSRSFGIDPTRRYNYSKQDMIIYELKEVDTNSLPPPPRADGTNTETTFMLRSTRTLHRKLAGTDEAAAFVRLTAAKRLSGQQIQTLSLLLREKQIELAKYDEILLTDFAISRDRMYRYDSKARTLFEIIPCPETSAAKPDSPKQ